MIHGTVAIKTNDKIHVMQDLIVDSGFIALPKKLVLEDQGGAGTIGDLDLKLGDSQQVPAPSDTDLIGSQVAVDVDWTTVNKTVSLGTALLGTHSADYQFYGQATVGVRKEYIDFAGVGPVTLHEIVLWDLNGEIALARVRCPETTIPVGDNLDLFWFWHFDFIPNQVTGLVSDTRTYEEYMIELIRAFH